MEVENDFLSRKKYFHMLGLLVVHIPESMFHYLICRFQLHCLYCYSQNFFIKYTLIYLKFFYKDYSAFFHIPGEKYVQEFAHILNLLLVGFIFVVFV